MKTAAAESPTADPALENVSVSIVLSPKRAKPAPHAAVLDIDGDL
jgi:hypothetical protein